MPVFAAVDLGASGGRVMAGHVAGGAVSLEAVHRFPNGVVECDGHLRWDLKRLLAAELGGHGIWVNGINPDGVVRGSGIFAGGWGASRAAVYGVEEDKLGEFYAQRTLLKREVLTDHVADAVAVLCSDELGHTTGLLVPVDSGVTAAFLR